MQASHVTLAINIHRRENVRIFRIVVE